MTGRRRLKAAEKRMVQAVVDDLVSELGVAIAQVEVAIVHHVLLVPVELREEALRMAMNEVLGSVYTGAAVGLAIKAPGTWQS